MSGHQRMCVPFRSSCFEVFGFDIMLDAELRAWLIEVNTTPALNADTPLDARVKTGMVADLLHLVGPVPYSREVYEEAAGLARQARLTGLLPRCSGPMGEHLAAMAAAKAATPLKELPTADYDWGAVRPEALPDIVAEAEAEYSRRRGWHRAFPAPDDPDRYLSLFETPRQSSLLQAAYYRQTARAKKAAARMLARRATATASTPPPPPPAPPPPPFRPHSTPPAAAVAAAAIAAAASVAAAAAGAPAKGAAAAVV